MTDREIALSALEQLSAKRCDDYNDWLMVGMILQHVGCTVQDWDNWSRNSSKYKPKVCERKWSSFHGDSVANVSVGTLLSMVKEDGGHVEIKHRVEDGHPLTWEDEIGPLPDVHWTEDADVPPPSKDWDKDLSRYLRTLFKPEEIVSYNIKAWQPPDSEKWIPQGHGTYTQTAGELIAKVEAKDSADAVYYDKPTPAGGWIRFNPVDGKGIKDANVTDYRYCLVESDNLPLVRQIAIYHQLELPIAAMVHSGGKSVHAIVRIEAGTDFEEYRKRVDFLFGVLKKAGFTIDRQNRNPSRLSRLPGILRGENPQYLMATNIGKPSWEAWKQSIDELDDNLPDIEDLSALAANPPPLAQEIIRGVLRCGHRLLFSGPSKAGKSFGLMELCLALGNGTEWLGMPCQQGRVLYVNLEIDRPSSVQRFIDIAGQLQLKITNIDVWNLRGKACPLNELAPRLVRRMRNKNYLAVIIDPLYKILTGDENSAADMTYFCNQLDYVAVETKTAVIFASHFSKGAQGGKRSIDRTSGSGVFGRDPDAVMTMTELDTPDGDAYRIEFTLREFAAPEPISVKFRYPVHVLDESLSGAKTVGDDGKTGAGRKPRISDEDIKQAIELRMGFDETNHCTLESLESYFDEKIKVRGLRYRIIKMKSEYIIDNNEVVRI